MIFNENQRRDAGKQRTLRHLQMARTILIKLDLWAVIGKSPSMKEVFRLIERVAD